MVTETNLTTQHKYNTSDVVNATVPDTGRQPRATTGQQQRLLKMAQSYLDKGIAVVPVSGKHPTTKWQEFVGRLPTSEEVETMFTSNSNITGLAIVLGEATWQRHPYDYILEVEARYRGEAKPWLDKHLPGWRDGRLAESGAGSLHIYLKSPTAVATSKYAWGEVRGNGSITVLPPSLHPKTKKAYRWLSKGQPIAVDPRRLALPGLSRGAAGYTALADGPIHGGEGRNVALTSLAGSLQRDGFDAPIIEAALMAVNRARCQPALDEAEVRSIAKSVGRYNTLDAGHRPTTQEEHSNRNFNNNSSNRQLIVNVDPVYFSQMAAPPPEEWIIPNFLPKEQPAMIHANGGSTKSIQALGMGICVASGGKWLGQQAEQRPVAYLDFELGEAATHRRAISIARGLGLPKVPENFAYFPLVGYTFAQVGESIQAWLADNPDGVLILDSYGAASTGSIREEENVITFIRKLRDMRGGGLFIIDHQARLQHGESYSNKGAFGSVYKENLCRVIWQLEVVDSAPGKALLVMRNKKNTFGPKLPDIGLEVLFDANKDEIRFNQVDITEGPLVAKMNLETRIRSALKEIGKGTAKVIIETLSKSDPLINADSVRAKLSQMAKSPAAGHGIAKCGRDGKEVIYALDRDHCSQNKANVRPAAPPQGKKINANTPYSQLNVNHAPNTEFLRSNNGNESDNGANLTSNVQADQDFATIDDPDCFWCPAKQAHCANCRSSELCEGATPFVAIGGAD